MNNPLLIKSTLPYGAPQFDKIENKHYITAFKQAIEEGKAEVDAIVNNTEVPTFHNTSFPLSEMEVLQSHDLRLYLSWIRICLLL